MDLNLSRREREVWQLLIAGKSNKEIARHLGISPSSVKTYLHRLYRKLGVSSRVEAICLYFRVYYRVPVSGDGFVDG